MDFLKDSSACFPCSPDHCQRCRWPPRVAPAAIITLDCGSPHRRQVRRGDPSGKRRAAELYASFQNNDGNRANDAFQLAHGALLSVETASGALGNLQPLTLTRRFLDQYLCLRLAWPTNLDARSDLEIGRLGTPKW